MKKLICLLLVMVFLCLNLSSCDAWDALRYAISGDIVEPIDGFSRGSKKNTLILHENKYILFEELNGEFRIDKTKEHIRLGQQSNFPFFPNSGFYATDTTDPLYIGVGSGFTITCVYLKEGAFPSPMRYTLEGTEYSFDFASAFVKTNEVNYNRDIVNNELPYKRIKIHIVDYPELKAEIGVYRLNGTWYFTNASKTVEVYKLSEDFANTLVERHYLY